MQDILNLIETLQNQNNETIERHKKEMNANESNAYYWYVEGRNDSLAYANKQLEQVKNYIKMLNK